MGRHTLALTAVVAILAASTASGQSVLDRAVGADAFGRPLEFRAFTPHEIGALAQAAGVPIAFEALPAGSHPAARRSIVLTGRSVRDAAAAMISLDARYQTGEEDGVVFFRPADPDAVPLVEAGSAPQPMDGPAPAVRLGDTTAREALGVVAALLGAPRSTAIGFSDTKPFVLDAAEGTVRSLLNAIVRSHGHLVWVFARNTGSSQAIPYTLTFMSGAHGWGLGLSGRRTEETLDLSRFGRPAAPPLNRADAIVGPRADGEPLVLSGVSASAARDLAVAARVPVGIQIASGRDASAGPYAAEFVATNRPLREVLETLVATDGRYNWRLADGTVLIRPVKALEDAGDPLFALVPAVQLENVPMTEAMRTVAGALGGLDQTLSSFPDGKSISLSVGSGTALDLLTALVKAHGSLTWTLEDAAPDEVHATGLHHRLTIGVVGGAGLGVLVR